MTSELEKMDFARAVAEAATNQDFVSQYNRLTGNNFGFRAPRNGLEAIVDKACGFKGFCEEEALKFAAFFLEYVWSVLPDECFTEMETPQ